jgi:hypothetical protein
MPVIIVGAHSTPASPHLSIARWFDIQTPNDAPGRPIPAGELAANQPVAQKRLYEILISMAWSVDTRLMFAARL